MIRRRWWWQGCLSFVPPFFLLISATSVRAKFEKPTAVVEDFYRLLQIQHYAEASELLSTADKTNLQSLKKKADLDHAAMPNLEKALADHFFMLQDQENSPMRRKAGNGDVIMPVKVGFFVPGQYYMVGKYAVVFTRETYELIREDTGPVRDDPRKLWMDPTNDLSKLRDEPYFKEWWVWEDVRLTMPGMVWLVREDSGWKIDLFSGSVPKKAFRKILHWHFGRDIFETMQSKPAEAAAKPGAPDLGKGKKAAMRRESR